MRPNCGQCTNCQLKNKKKCKERKCPNMGIKEKPLISLVKKTTVNNDEEVPVKNQKLQQERKHLLHVENSMIEEIDNPKGLTGKIYKCRKCNTIHMTRIRAIGHAQNCGTMKTGKKKGKSLQKLICNQCKFTCSLSKVMTNHRRYSHSSLFSHKYHCTICKTKISSAKAFAVHCKRHKKVMSFPCLKCGKKLSTAGNRKRHLMTHESKTWRFNECVRMPLEDSQPTEARIETDDVLPKDGMKQPDPTDQHNKTSGGGLSQYEILRNRSLQKFTDSFLDYCRNELLETDSEILRIQQILQSKQIHPELVPTQNTTVDIKSSQVSNIVSQTSTSAQEECQIGSLHVFKVVEEISEISKPLGNPNSTKYLVVSNAKKGHDVAIQVDMEPKKSEGRKLYVCNVCSHRFRDNNGLTRHNTSMHHPGESLFTCARYWCVLEFQTKFERNQHQEECKLFCTEPGCNRRGMVWRRDVEQHKNFHTAQKRKLENQYLWI